MSIRDRLCAYWELGSRYGQVWRHCWGQRHKLRSGLFLEHEAEFLPTALAVQERPVSRTARVIAWFIIIMTLTALAWAIFGRMDIIVNAGGKVIPSSRVKTIASVDTASVVELFVADGQSVRAGDMLIQLNTEVIQADRGKALKELTEAVLQQSRNQALVAAIDRGAVPTLPAVEQLNEQYGIAIDAARWQVARDHLRSHYVDYTAKLKRLESDILLYEQELPFARQQAENYRELNKTGDVPRNDYLAREQALVQLRGQLRSARSQRESLTAETVRQAFEEIAAARRIIEAASHDAQRQNALGKLYTLKAPVDGTVQQLAVHTIGGVVPAAQPIMQIVPQDGPVEIEAFIENKDIGFVFEDQQARIKVATFEFTKYGTLPGRVTHVSQDAIEDPDRGLIYAVRVLLEKSTLNVNGRTTRVTPGMAVNVEIKTGSRRIIEYVLSPLIRHTDEALNER